MAFVLSSISGNLISAASAGYAPTNSADVSGIASAYSESAASGKLDSSASSSFYGVDNPSGFITGVDLSNYATTAYVDSSVSGKLDSSASSSFYTTANESGFVDSAYVESAVSGKADSSALSSYALSSDVSGVIDTVSSNSASWGGGGGGSVVSPSGTILVTNGNQVEGTNSAVSLTQTSTGATSVMSKSPSLTAIGPGSMTPLGMVVGEPGRNLVFMLATSYHGSDATVVISGRDNYWNLVSASGLIVEGDTSGNIPLDTTQWELSASSNYLINLMDGQGFSAVKFPGYTTGVGELAWNSALTGVSSTVANNSATWGQGGGITGDYLTSKVGSGQATFSTAFQDGLEKRPSLVIAAERTAGVNMYPRMMVTDWNDTSGDTHSGMLLANAFEFYTCPTSARGETDPSGFVQARLDPNKFEMLVDDGVSSKTRSALYSRSGMEFGKSGDTASWVKVTGDTYYGGLISLDSRNGIHGVIYPSSVGYWNGKLDGSASSSFYTTANESGYVDSATVSSIASAYAESAASGKQDSLTFAYDADSAISSINGSAVAGGFALLSGLAWDNSSSAYVSAPTKLSTLNRVGRADPNTLIRQNTVSGLVDDRGIDYYLEATWLAPDAVQVSSNSTFRYMPKNSMWTTADQATGVFTPLRYATGACLAMDSAPNFKAYYKGNEWFVADIRYGMLRGEIHQSRGLRIVASGANSASGFQIHPSGVDGVDTDGSAWRYGANEYTSLTSVYDTVSSNSASWNGKMDSSAVQSAYASASATQATASGVLYILLPDGA